MTAAFVLVVTWMLGAGDHHAGQSTFSTLGCQNMKCVEMVVGAAQKDPRVAELRVFPSEDYAGIQNGMTAFPPIADFKFT